jgi:hypothetical protein
MPAHHNILDLDEIIADYDPAGAPVDRVRTAQALVQAAIGILDQVARETNDRHARAYMVDQLATLASNDHGFLSCGFTLDAWVQQLEDGDDEEAEDE